MGRELTAVQPLSPGDHAPALSGDPADWLPSPRPAGLHKWRIEIAAGGLHRVVVCEVGDPWVTGEGLTRRVTWVPQPGDADPVPVERLLPSLEGELFLVGPEATPSLLLAGEVSVPLGRVGEAMDAVLLGRVAQRSAASFLSAVATRLSDLLPEVATTNSEAAGSRG